MTQHTLATPLLGDFLRESAERVPDREALIAGQWRLSYREMHDQATAFASALAARGVERGDRVLIVGENAPETAIAFWGALAANAVPAIVSPQTKQHKIAYLLGDCRPRALVSHAPLVRNFAEPAAESTHLAAVVVSGAIDADRLRTLPGGVAWDEALAQGAASAPPPRRCIDIDLASLIYTSGSTGEPKGVIHTHASMRAAARSVAAYLELRQDDRIVCALERSFVYPTRVLDRMESERVTGFPGVPTMFAMLGELSNLGDYDLSSVQFVTNTAAALSRKHIELARKTFPNARIYSMYGLTECKRVTYLPPEDLDRKPDSVGIAIPNTEIWIADEQGGRLGSGELGEIVVRGATVMRGYWKKPEATARRLTPGLLPGEKVLRTGDYGKLDDDGYLYFVGRMDDIIKSRGEKVAPREVELALVDIPGVKEAAVVGVDDPMLGQAIAAYVVLERGASLDERAIRRGCQQRLEGFMVPTHVAIVQDLPKTTTGKINKSRFALPDRRTTAR